MPSSLSSIFCILASWFFILPLQVRAYVKTVEIALSQPWTHTQLVLKRGQKFNITANGTLFWYYGHCDACKSTPDGQAPPNDAVAGRLIARGLPAYSLIGRIGASSSIFDVGSCYSGTASADGELFLGVNDERTAFGDNAGQWTAFVTDRPKPQIGDVIAFWDQGVLVHSGLVSEVDGCKVTSFSSYIIDTWLKVDLGGVSVASPEGFGIPATHPYDNWTIYHTDGAKKIKVVPSGTDGKGKNVGVTSKNNLLVVNWPERNCHGYTFISDPQHNYGIMGYYIAKRKGDPMEVHDQKEANDQAIAAQIILRDNGYYQIPANGPDAGRTIPHFMYEYEIKNFGYMPN